jgi:hypothetical protein
MGIGKARSILAPVLFVLNLPVALARALLERLAKLPMGVEGGLNFACVDVCQCNNGRVGVSLSEEAQITINGAVG